MYSFCLPQLRLYKLRECGTSSQEDDILISGEKTTRPVNTDQEHLTQWLQILYLWEFPVFSARSLLRGYSGSLSEIELVKHRNCPPVECKKAAHVMPTALLHLAVTLVTSAVILSFC